MSDELFALKVKGDMYANALVADGDIVVIKKTGVLSNGDLGAIFLKDSSEMVLMRFYLEGTFDEPVVRLQPCHPFGSPKFYVPGMIAIEGKVQIVIRNTEASHDH